VCHARADKVFVAACDMPFLNAEVVRGLCARAGEGDVIIPAHENGLEPLHALYSKSCITPMEEALDRGQKRIVGFFPQVDVSEVKCAEWQLVDPDGLSFRNINTPEEYYRLRESVPASGARQGVAGRSTIPRK
ncbi:MAG: molybdenum cofactor guanylyltransferase, partial [Desulfuromonadales bacterium]|nr:molybdenum cofactor guanylyltransferase [Desulfuromonadales bacterium]NIS43807.1 molybdenum cofactor guanylyltransferase [Desulfuromonadales bacterium]